MPTLEIHLLGDFNFTYEKAHAEILDSARLQSLLVYLLLRRQAPQSRQHLAFLLWPDTSERQAQSNLRNLLHRLRTAFTDIDQFLHIDTRTLRWRDDARLLLDVADFEAALQEAAQNKGGMAAETALPRAVALYTGDLLPNFDQEWVAEERDRLRGRFIEALEALITLHENQRNYEAAIAYTQRLLRHDPLHEPAYQRLMQLYALNGDRASALRTYHTCVTVLERELAVPPDAATRKLYERLVDAGAKPQTAHTSTSPLATMAPFIGRQREWQQLKALWRKVTFGSTHLAVIAGEAGIGKTRLVEELLTWAERQNYPTAIARCYAAEGTLAYAPVIAWLRSPAVQKLMPQLDLVWLAEISRLLPELSLSHPHLPRFGPMTEVWQRQRLFEALAQALLLCPQPLLLVIDDLQWCDRESIAWLHFLLRHAATTSPVAPRAGGAQRSHAPLFIVGTLRSGDLAAYEPLADLLAGLRSRSQLSEMELVRLSPAEAVDLSTKIAGRPLAAATAARLVDETEGNPLFIVEMVRAGLATPTQWGHETEPARAPFVRHQPLPATVQRVLETHLGLLAPPARELVDLAAAIGREFAFVVLAAASDRDEDTLVQGLDELWQRRIVREQGSEAYDFTHGLLREVAYANLSAARRRLLHRRIAQAMTQVYSHDLDAVCGQVAVQCELGGLVEQAVLNYQRAAATAEKIYANAEAIQYYRRALALTDPAHDHEARRAVAAQLHEGLADILVLAGQVEEARANFEQAFQGWPLAAQIRRAVLQQKIGETWERQHQHEQALGAYVRAETTLGMEFDSPKQEWWQAWLQVQQGKMGVYYWRNQPHLIGDIMEKVRPAVAEHGMNIQLAKFYNSLASIHWRRDRYRVAQETLDLCQSALDVSLETGTASEIALMRFSVGFSQLWHGDLEAAEQAFQATLALAEQAGDLDRQLACLIYLGITYRKRGQVESVRKLALQSLGVAEMLQRMVYIGTAKANLAWVAWRLGDLSESQRYAGAALALWHDASSSQTHYPFQWAALWPLIGVSLAQGQMGAALVYLRHLLDPAQQALPEELAALVTEALLGADTSEPARTHTRLQQACELAQTQGYL